MCKTGGCHGSKLRVDFVSKRSKHDWCASEGARINREEIDRAEVLLQKSNEHMSGSWPYPKEGFEIVEGFSLADLLIALRSPKSMRIVLIAQSVPMDRNLWKLDNFQSSWMYDDNYYESGHWLLQNPT